MKAWQFTGTHEPLVSSTTWPNRSRVRTRC